MIKRYKYFLVAALLGLVVQTYAADKVEVNVYKQAQQPDNPFSYKGAKKTIYPWESIIRSYEQADKLNTPPQNAWLFIGSSSINRWHSLQNDFSKQKVIKRGFGGATLSQLYHYRDRILVNYKPVKVIIYTGNIGLKKDAKSQKDYMNDFIELYSYIHERCPNTQIYMVSLKPSPMRMSEWAQADMANKAVKKHCANVDYLTFVDITSGMFKDGCLDETLFDKDQIHLNENGYKVFLKSLKKELKHK
jgi:lysophospholipase L1-like esterase